MNKNLPELNLRDYFAGQALIGIAAECEKETNMRSEEPDYGTVAEIAYAYADAMLAAREVDPTKVTKAIAAEAEKNTAVIKLKKKEVPDDNKIRKIGGKEVVFQTKPQEPQYQGLARYRAILLEDVDYFGKAMGFGDTKYEAYRNLAVALGVEINSIEKEWNNED